MNVCVIIVCECNSCVGVTRLSSVWKDGSERHIAVVGNVEDAGKQNNVQEWKDFLKNF